MKTFFNVAALSLFIGALLQFWDNNFCPGLSLLLASFFIGSMFK